MTDAAIASFATMVVTIGGFVHAAWRSRVAVRVLRLQREWDVSDRERARADSDHKAVIRSEVIAAQISAGHDAATSAYDIANHAKDKLEVINARLEALSERLIETVEKVDVSK